MYTAIPPGAAYRVGLKKKDFLLVVSRINVTKRSDMRVLGAVVMEFSWVPERG